jgi:hypothetical protein
MKNDIVSRHFTEAGANKRCSEERIGSRWAGRSSGHSRLHFRVEHWPPALRPWVVVRY